MQIKIFATGGTIDKIYFDELSDFKVGEPQVGEVLKGAQVSFDYAVHSILRKDSLDLTDDDRRLIFETVRADPCRRIVITHGTDTMIETAKVLQAIPDKVMVLTGAMQPARFKITDAIFNIGCALMAVQLQPPGVYIAMNGRLFDPLKTRKNRSHNRFEMIP
ncbi:MAG: asparaginase domain-containing protein [Desulfobacterales bacterium]|jgi:L-asparaginase